MSGLFDSLPVKPVVLWTDALLFLLIAGILAAVWYVRRKPHLASGWRRVGQSSVAMSAATLLALFVAAGVLDSLHFRSRLDGAPASGAAQAGGTRYSVEVRSALDALLAGLRGRNERTYSAPLATHLFQRETVEGPDGKQTREFPRLRHGGAHLTDPAGRDADVALRAAAGAAGGAILWGVLALAVTALLARRGGYRIAQAWREIRADRTELALRAMLVTAFALLLVAGAVAALAGGYHVMGTDKVGQDVLYLTLKSIRTALVIGTLTTLVMLPFALALGIAAGYFGGWIDDVIQYLYTTLNSIPSVLLIAASVLMMQVVIDTHPGWFETSAERADARLLALCAILGVTSWTGLCRLLRGETLKLRELDYVAAARAFGVSRLRIMSRHILPNLMHIVMISVVMDFSGLVLAEAVLSYVGVGVDPTTVSFGTMINTARLELSRDPIVWWALADAFCFMFAMVLAANLFADAVRDAFDPRTTPLARARRRLAQEQPA